MPAVPKLTGAFAPPKFTTSGELPAAKPPLAFAAHCTWPAAAPIPRVKVPTVSITASVPPVAWLKIRLLFPDRLLIEPKARAAPFATVALELSRMCVGSRIAAIVVPPEMPVPDTAWPITRPYELLTQRSVVALAAASVVALVAFEFASCATSWPCVIVVAPE